MPPIVASFVFVFIVIALFWLDRDPEEQVSKAILLPLVWLWLQSSRTVTEWWAILGHGAPLSASQETMYMEGSPLDRNVLIVLMVLALVILIKRRKLEPLLRVNLVIVAYLLYALMSAFWSDFPDVTIRRWFKAAGCLLMILVVLSERHRDAATRKLFVWAGFLLIPHSILLIKYYPSIGRSYNRWTWEMSVIGVTTHKNTLGGICQLYGAVFLWYFIAAYRNREMPNRSRRLLAHGAALVMVAWVFLHANSVTAQSCFLLAAALMVIGTTRAVVRSPWLIHALTAGLVAVPFTILFLGIGGGAITEMGRDPTLTGRTNIWPRVIALVDNPILGTGFESFWLGPRLVKMQNYQLGLNETHNGYLETWVTLGWIGVFLLAIMVFKGYRSLIVSYRADPASGSLKLAIFLTVIVSSFTEAAFKTGSISWIAFLLVTMSIPKEQLVEAPVGVRVGWKSGGESGFDRDIEMPKPPGRLPAPKPTPASSALSPLAKVRGKR
ncbi:MAG TPA: O-antigen ligase family protein [Dongiaceae bacterium]|nr:O-antigen ligase family protein [Dongiaceae bacterium]